MCSYRVGKAIQKEDFFFYRVWLHFRSLTQRLNWNWPFEETTNQSAALELVCTHEEAAAALCSHRRLQLPIAGLVWAKQRKRRTPKAQDSLQIQVWRGWMWTKGPFSCGLVCRSGFSAEKWCYCMNVMAHELVPVCTLHFLTETYPFLSNNTIRATHSAGCLLGRLAFGKPGWKKIHESACPNLVLSCLGTEPAGFRNVILQAVTPVPISGRSTVHGDLLRLRQMTVMFSSAVPELFQAGSIWPTPIVDPIEEMSERWPFTSYAVKTLHWQKHR